MQQERLSYASGPSTQPLLGMTIGEQFDQACQQYAEKEAIVSFHQNRRLTYKALQDEVNAFACSLLKLGLKKGDRLAIWSPNCVEWTITQFAAFKAGIILVNLNTAYKSHELEYVLNKVSCKGLIIASQFKTTDYQELLTKIAPELTTCTDKVLSSERLPHLKFVIKIDDQQHTGIYRFSDLLTTPGLGGKYQITPDTLLKADYYHVKGDGRFLLWSNSGYAIDDQNNMYSNEFDTVSLGITHQFTPQIRSTLGYGYMKAKDDNRFAELQRTSTTQNKQLWQGWVNALYNPYKPITLGIEYVYGERETFDNRNGIDNRFNMIASYDF